MQLEPTIQPLKNSGLGRCTWRRCGRWLQHPTGNLCKVVIKSELTKQLTAHIFYQCSCHGNYASASVVNKITYESEVLFDEITDWPRVRQGCWHTRRSSDLRAWLSSHMAPPLNLAPPHQWPPAYIAPPSSAHGFDVAVVQLASNKNVHRD